MKPYILNYSETINIQYATKSPLDSTFLTNTTEPSDRDEYCLSSTSVTRSIEPSDPDEIYSI